MSVLAFAYSCVADVVGFYLLVKTDCLLTTLFFTIHGRLVSSYLVHEFAHSTVFSHPLANHYFGMMSLWLCGTPYGDFTRIRNLHLSHHKDRADTVEFDYRAFVKALPSPLYYLVLGSEYCMIPIVETIMHLRTAIFPLIASPSDARITSSRRRNALIGSTATIALYAWLYRKGCLFLYLFAGAVVLQVLAFHDCFQHTYEAVLEDENYVPGPGPRTAQYEHDNTYTNPISLQFPFINAFVSLNFGYHNAHHKKAMVPWYKLPELHQQYYSNSAQILPSTHLFRTWLRHRIRRVLEIDYGTVHPQSSSSPNDDRTLDFIGSLGVSFLTV